MFKDSDKRKKFIIFIILGVLILLIIPILERFIMSLLESKFDISLIDGEYIKQIALDKNTYLGFYNFKFDNPAKVLGYVLIAWYVSSYLLGLMTSFSPKQKFEQVDGYGSHGTSRWQTDKEVKESYYSDKKGWFLGANDKIDKYKLGMNGAYHRVNGKLNMQMVVVGPPGSNKTTGFVLPNIFHLVDVYRKEGKGEMPDLIITDPKSELFCLTSKYLNNEGYDVKVLDFINLKFGDSINPIEFIEDDKTLLEICKGFVESVEGSRSQGGASGDMAFWNGQEAQLLGALVGYVIQTYKKEDRTFGNVLELLTSDKVYDEYKSKELFAEANIQGTALQLWNNFLSVCDNERTKSNVIGGLAEKMVLFSIGGIERITQKTTVDLTKLGAKKKKPMALFILMPDGDSTFSPIINVMVSILFKQLYKNAYKTGNKLVNPVYFIIEEMANIGKLPNIKEMLGTMRGRRIYPMMIWQSLAQMKDRYKDGFEDIMSMCDTHVYLGVNDGFTSKYCSASLGETTIQVQNTSKKGDSGLLNINERSEAKNYQQRKLLLPDEIERLDNDLMIIRQRASYPALLYKIQYKYWEEKLCDEVTMESLKELDPLPKSISKNEISESDYENDKDKMEPYKEIKSYNIAEEVNNDVEEERSIFDSIDIDDYSIR
jgi:type IV secretion system protein VirD4